MIVLYLLKFVSSGKYFGKNSVLFELCHTELACYR